MRHLILQLFCFVVLFSNAQVVEKNAGDQANMNNRFSGIRTNIDASVFINPSIKPKGTLYLFEKWENRGVLDTKDGRKLSIRNINLNVDKQVFESSFAKDSIYQFSFDNVESITINNKKYNQLKLGKFEKVYEMLFESEDYLLLKTYKIKVFKGSPNPMLIRKEDVYDIIEEYYVVKGGDYKEIRLNERNILKIFNGNDKLISEMETYIDDNSIDCSNEFSVTMLLKHFIKS